MNKVGLMAQDVKLFYPGTVSEDSYGNLTLNYQEIIPVLISAIKEQQDQ